MTRVAQQLTPGEHVLADAGVRSMRAIVNQSTSGVRIVLTDRRILFFRLNTWTGGVTTKSALDPVPLEAVVAMSTETRHLVATVGIPVFILRLAVGPETILTMGSSGFTNRRFRHLVERLAELRPGLPLIEQSGGS